MKYVFVPASVVGGIQHTAFECDDYFTSPNRNWLERSCVDSKTRAILCAGYGRSKVGRPGQNAPIIGHLLERLEVDPGRFRSPLKGKALHA